MKYILAYLLHHANRSISRIVVGRDEFYAIKKMLLKQYGEHIVYEIQHFEGKKCYTCGGSGVYTGYYFSGHKWQDSCNRCIGGWFKLPAWVCLEKLKMGMYRFHQPIKREECVKNPFSKEEIGWEVSKEKIIQGYIEHDHTEMGWYALMILFYLYDRSTYIRWRAEIIDQIKWRWTWKWRGLKCFFSWETYAIKPEIRIHQLDMDGNIIDDLPFD